MSFLASTARRIMSGQVRPWRATPGQTLGVRWAALEPAEQYAMLRAYYNSNGLYQEVAEALRTYSPQLWDAALRPLRNPTFRVVEAYASTVAHGPLDVALPIVSDNEAIKEPIKQVWAWSNWQSQKQVAVRWLARDGDLFVKVATRTDPAGRPIRVYFQLIDAAHVTEFDTDERGFLTYLRLDLPQTRRVGDETEEWVHTEIWDKATETYRLWERQRWLGLDLTALGTPTREEPLAAFGIDFLPFVHIMFRDVGEPLGHAAITPAIDMIDEANRVATRLHQILYRHNKPLWAVHGSGNAPDGRPLPPPPIGGAATGDSDGVITLGDDQMIGLPGTAQMTPLVPALNYGAHLDALRDMVAEIERALPASVYSRIRELSAMSGVAIRFLLTDFIDSVIEVRGNLYDGLARLDAMALTIGANARLSQFANLGGTFESGAFEHSFDGPDIVPLSEGETQQARLVRAQAIKAETDAGVSLERALLDSGYEEPEVKAMVAEHDRRAAEMAASLAARPAQPFDREEEEGA